MSLSSIHRLWAIMAGTGDGVLKNITGKAGGHTARFCHAAESSPASAPDLGTPLEARLHHSGVTAPQILLDYW
jgi:hypothetical protein